MTVHRVTYTFAGTDPGTIPINENELVIVVDFNSAEIEGWTLGVNVNSKEFGYFPEAYIEKPEITGINLATPEKSAIVAAVDETLRNFEDPRKTADVVKVLRNLVSQLKSNTLGSHANSKRRAPPAPPGANSSKSLNRSNLSISRRKAPEPPQRRSPSPNPPNKNPTILKSSTKIQLKNSESPQNLQPLSETRGNTRSKSGRSVLSAYSDDFIDFDH